MAGLSLSNSSSGSVKKLEQDLLRPISDSENYYKEYEYTKGALSKIDFYESSLKSTLIYTATYVYNSLENVTQMNVTRSVDGRILQIDYNYDSNDQYLSNTNRTIL